MKKIIPLCMTLLILIGCKEEVDTSARYVFKEESVTSYLKKHADVYSTYTDILFKVPVSQISATTLGQLLSARGHYTVFAPTNDAIQLYLDTLAASDIIDSPSWDGFRDSLTLDSIRKVIAYNSIIDGGDDMTYFTTSFPILQDAEIPRANMYDRRLVVHQPNKYENEDLYLINDAPMDERNHDIPLLHPFDERCHLSLEQYAGAPAEELCGRQGRGILCRIHAGDGCRPHRHLDAPYGLCL